MRFYETIAYDVLQGRHEDALVGWQVLASPPKINDCQISYDELTDDLGDANPLRPLELIPALLLVGMQPMDGAPPWELSQGLSRAEMGMDSWTWHKVTELSESLCSRDFARARTVAGRARWACDDDDARNDWDLACPHLGRSCDRTRGDQATPRGGWCDVGRRSR